MDKEFQKLIGNVCAGFPTHDVQLSNIFDIRRFARMAHYAWIHDIGFHPDMFKEALKETELFKNLSDEALDIKSQELCRQADLVKSMFHAAFDLEHLSIK